VTYNVIVTPTADDEAMEAVRWYAERSPDAAQRWHDGLTRAIDSLAKMPTRCPVSQADSRA
jgi:plasmid stabilization system protein ParE